MNANSKYDQSENILDFQKYKLRTIAREYVHRLNQYGPECASFWSMGHVDDADKQRFAELVRQETQKRPPSSFYSINR